MLIRDPHTYQPPFWQWNGHIQTIYPSLYRKVTGIHYHRETITTDDDDFLLLDWAYAQSGKKQKSLAILSHGLEGDSHRPYITGMVKELNRSGIDCLAWNFRSCGGVMNRQLRFYHSGATDDLEHVIQHAINQGYQSVFLIGFSLGANLTLKYLGESGPALNENIKKTVVFSVPMDLKLCSLTLGKTFFRIYEQRFLRSLKLKSIQKSMQFPEVISQEKIKKIKSIYQFDDELTACLHGFESADDYYSKCSSMHFLSAVQCPTLILNAKNDPMIPYRSLPIDLLENHDCITFELTKEGGHCGFSSSRYSHDDYWSEKRAIRFINYEE
jgi:predicted alpha/beta-fold hydrolase